MPQIRINTDHTREVARRLIAESDRLAEMGHELQNATGGLDIWAWDGRSRSRAEPLLARVRPESARVAGVLDELGRKLRRVADIFEQKDNGAAGKLAAMPWVDFEAVKGSVLGVATVAGAVTPAIVLTSLPLTGESAPQVSDMKTWEERYARAEELPGQIEGLESEQEDLENDIAQDDKDIADLDQQIKDLEAERDALQEEADGFWNKVIPDWPLERDREDGLPWRVRADDYEDEIADYDRQIQKLQDQKNDLVQQRLGHQQSLDDVNGQLDTLRQSQTELNGVIAAGVPADGPTTSSNLLTGENSLSGCTHYVAEKRKVDDWPNANGESGHPGHAYKWSDQAQQAGYEVGSRPVKGSIAVWEGGSGWVDKTGHDCGHVAYVEWVDPDDPNHFRISEASVKTDAEGNGIRGTHTTPTTRDVYLNKEQDLNFIYDKSPESTSVA